eukprot:g19499.t1
MSLTSWIEENLKTFSAHIKSKRVTRKRVGPLKDKRNLCVEPVGVNEVLDEHFTSVFTEEKDVDDGKIGEGYVDILGHIDIKTEDVRGLENIKLSLSPGP